MSLVRFQRFMTDKGFPILGYVAFMMQLKSRDRFEMRLLSNYIVRGMLSDTSDLVLRGMLQTSLAAVSLYTFGVDMAVKYRYGQVFSLNQAMDICGNGFLFAFWTMEATGRQPSLARDLSLFSAYLVMSYVVHKME